MLGRISVINETECWATPYAPFNDKLLKVNLYLNLVLCVLSRDIDCTLVFTERDE